MSRFELGYLLLAMLVAGVPAALWYLWYNLHDRTWRRDDRRPRKPQPKAARIAWE